MLRRLLPLVAALALLMAGAPGARAAARGFEVGIQDDVTFVDRHFDAPTAYGLAKQLRVSWIRVMVPWARVVGKQARRTTRPARVTYDWGVYDRMIAEAQSHGFKVQLV